MSNYGIDLSVFLKMVGDLTKPMKDAEDKIKASTDRMKSSMSLSLKLAGVGAVAQGIKMAAGGLVSNFTESYKEVQRASGELRSLGMQDLQAVISEGQKLQSTYVGLTTDAFVRAAYDIKSGVSSLTDEGVAAMTSSALTVAKATKGVPEEMTSLFATSYGIFKKQFSEMSDADWGDMFGAALAKSVQQFKTDGAKMQQAIESAGAGATNLGMSMTEQMTLLGMMQQQMQAGEAGTAMRAFATNAAKAHEAFGDLSKDSDNPVRVHVLDENGQLRAMPDILSDLKARYGDTLDAFEAAEIKEAFGTDEAMKMINALYGQEDAVRANAEALEEAAEKGAEFTESMAASVDDYDGAAWELLAQKMDVIKQKIGAGLLPAMDKLAPILGSMAEAFGTFISQNPGLVAGFGAVVVGLGGIATVVAPLMFSISTLTASFGALRHGSVLMGVALRGTEGKVGLLSRAMTGLKAGFGVLKTAILGIGRALMANPIVLIVAGIAAAAYLIYKHWEPIKAFFSNLWQGVKNFTINAWESIKSAFMNYTPHGLIITHWDSISSWFSGLWGRVKTGMSTAWEGIKAAFMNYTPHGLIIQHWDSIASWFSNLWGRVRTGTTTAWEGIKSAFLSYTPHGLIITHWDSIATWFSGLWERVKTGVSLGWEGIKSAFVTYTPAGMIYSNWEGIATWFGGKWDQVKSTFTLKWEEIKAGTLGWASDFLAIGGNILTGLSNGITGGVQAVLDTISGIGASIVSTFKGILGIQSPSTVFAEFGGFLMDGLIGGLRAKIAAVRDAINGIGSSVVGWFKDKLGIASPSKVFAGLGGHLSEGLAVGIDRQKGMVFASMEGIRRDLARPMLATATIGATAMSAAAASPVTNMADLDVAGVQLSGAGKQIVIEYKPSYVIEITGDAGEGVEEKIRRALQEHDRDRIQDLERYLND
jgi:TP901 family phage tail tape measure protein